jgi:chitin disaccharide deacetylase
VSKSVPIVLCADDFGISPGVNDGILDLVERRRLSAVGCMTALPAFAAGSSALKAMSEHVDIGLHLTLSDQEPIGAMPNLAPHGRLPSFPRLLRAAIFGQLPADEIAAEFERQIAAFSDAFGESPDFLDGHHHVHQLPGIRPIVLAAAAKYGAKKKIYVRACNDSFRAISERGIAMGASMFIGAFGRSLRRDAWRLGISTNTGFAGAYDYKSTTPYGEVFPHMIRALAPGSIVFCHPGIPDPDLRRRDSFVENRVNEYNYLRSDAFPALLDARKITLRRFFDSSEMISQ